MNLCIRVTIKNVVRICLTVQLAISPKGISF